MKKFFAFLAAALLVVACGGGNTKNEEEKPKTFEDLLLEHVVKMEQAVEDDDAEAALEALMDFQKWSEQYESTDEIEAVAAKHERRIRAAIIDCTEVASDVYGGYYY